MARLRIGIDATSLLGQPTGVGTVTRALLERLVCEPDLALTGLLVSVRGRGQLAAQLPAGVGERAMPFPARLAHLLWSRIDHPSLGGFDLVHGPNFVVPPARRGAELLTIHDFGPWHYPELVNQSSRAYPRLVARALRRGAHVHVVSAFVGDEARALLGLDAERVHVIPNGLGRQLPGDARRGRDRVGGLYVVAVGTIEPRKDLPTLVAAMARLWAADHDLKLVVVGSDGWGTPAFETAVADAGPLAAARVIRPGYVDDQERADLLAGAACLAFPSRYEGFGLPPLEAMAQSTPVVATAIGAVTEVCDDAALVVPVGDADALAEAILSVLADEALADRLRAAGRARLELFSWDRAAADMAELYRRLGSSR